MNYSVALNTNINNKKTKLAKKLEILVTEQHYLICI